MKLPRHCRKTKSFENQSHQPKDLIKFSWNNLDIILQDYLPLTFIRMDVVVRSSGISIRCIFEGYIYFCWVLRFVFLEICSSSFSRLVPWKREKGNGYLFWMYGLFRDFFGCDILLNILNGIYDDNGKGFYAFFGLAAAETLCIWIFYFKELPFF